jgi:hypothetical protein
MNGFMGYSHTTKPHARTAVMVFAVLKQATLSGFRVTFSWSASRIDEAQFATLPLEHPSAFRLAQAAS